MPCCVRGTDGRTGPELAGRLGGFINVSYMFTELELESKSVKQALGASGEVHNNNVPGLVGQAAALIGL